MIRGIQPVMLTGAGGSCRVASRGKKQKTVKADVQIFLCVLETSMHVVAPFYPALSYTQDEFSLLC